MKHHKEAGFTLIEMLIVLMIITVLIILLVPNLSKRSEDVHSHGCSALINTVQAQVQAYQLDEGKLPNSLDTLVTEKYIEAEQKSCPNGEALKYNQSDGKVSLQ